LRIKEGEFVQCGRVKSSKTKTDLDTELNIQNKTTAVSKAFSFTMEHSPVGQGLLIIEDL
jgi:hypothetical protein